MSRGNHRQLSHFTPVLFHPMLHEENTPCSARSTAGTKSLTMEGGWVPQLPLKSLGAEPLSTMQDWAQRHYRVKISGKLVAALRLTEELHCLTETAKNLGEAEFLLLQCLLRRSEWHQLRRNLAGHNLLILCHLHPFSEQCQLSAFELFKFSFPPSVSAAQDCKSFSCKRKARQPLSLQASVGLFLCQKM